VVIVSITFSVKINLNRSGGNMASHCDAERAVNDNSYKGASDSQLREWRIACERVGGNNTTAVDRIRRVGDVILAEINARQAQHPHLTSVPINSVPDSVSFAPTNSSWDEARIKDLIRDRIEENATLEYKAAGALSRDKRDEITKDISAMANSAGGTIIYGLSEFQQASLAHLPEKIDPIDRTQFSKEWLEHIASQIRPRIPELRIHVVDLSSSPSDVAYIVEVPQGSTAHQATTLRYHRRYNFECLMMTDHEIRDVMSRKTNPKIEVSVSLFMHPRQNADGTCGRLIFDIRNHSDVFCRYVFLAANVPVTIQGKPVSYDGPKIFEDLDGETGYKIFFSNHDAPPLFPRSRLSPYFDLRWVGLMEPRPEKPSEHYKFMVFADSMPCQRGAYTFNEVYQKRD
jgi:hypothetical protein